MAYTAGSLEINLIHKANDVVSVFSALNKELRITKKLISTIMGGTSKTTQKLINRQNKTGGMFGFGNLAKMGATLYTARRIGRVVSEIAQKGSDYTETLNMWETSMGNNLMIATEFVNKMNDAYGISEKTLMNAQAIFKNMLGSLGQISDTMAYQLSEGITQMALDYASLYNVTFEQAFTKFQAALAGQVRPIRSVAGYDITETTLFQLYQELGGTKTMRQLTRTEKQLLSILAIFNQMDKSGAIGDLNKTMGSFANQSRVMAESWQQVLSYSGILITHMIEQSGFLTNVNAFLIFIGDTLKAIVEDLGAVKHFGGDAFEAITEGATNANEEVEKLQGKLLGFDEFRALNETQQDTGIGLDERLLNALANFDTILGNANMEAKNLAENLKSASGLFNEDGSLNKDKLQGLVDTIEAFGHALLAIVTSGIIKKFALGITAIGTASVGVKNILLTGIIFAIIQAIDAFRDGDKVSGIIAITIGVTLVGAFIALKGVLIDGKLYLDLFGKTLNGTFLQITMGISMLIGGISLFIKNFDKLSTSAKIWIPIISALAGAIASLAVGFTIMKGNWVGAISIGAMVAGAGLMVGTKLATQDYANGGVPDRGTIFRAGEAGTEVVSHTNGVTEVTNVRQMEQAFLNALTRHSNSDNGKLEITLNLDGEKVYKNTTEHAKQHGFSWSKK